MGYVISLGSGLVLGIGLLIWALRERGKRHDAEVKLETVKTTATGLRKELVEATNSIEKMRAEGESREGQLTVLRETIDGLRTRLRECRDPEAVRAWLDEALGSGEL